MDNTTAQDVINSKCPFVGCYYIAETELQLTDHLRKFHSKRALARLSAWFSTRYGGRKID